MIEDGRELHISVHVDPEGKLSRLPARYRVEVSRSAAVHEFRGAVLWEGLGLHTEAEAWRAALTWIVQQSTTGFDLWPKPPSGS